MHVGGYHFFEVPFRMIIFIIIEECSTVKLFLYHTKKGYLIHCAFWKQRSDPREGKKGKEWEVKTRMERRDREGMGNLEMCTAGVSPVCRHCWRCGWGWLQSGRYKGLICFNNRTEFWHSQTSITHQESSKFLKSVGCKRFSCGYNYSFHG